MGCVGFKWLFGFNLLVPFYILYKHYHFQEADKKKYIPFVLFSVGWAFAIHLVTAFCMPVCQLVPIGIMHCWDLDF